MKEKELEKVFKALANKRRLAIVSNLQKRGKRNVGQIAEAIKLSFRATSKHLSILAGVDILEREQKSKQTFYNISGSTNELIKHILKVLS